MASTVRLPSPDRAGRRRCCHRGQAANPGTGRTPMVPLFGLAPGGVWPSLRHRRRPDALTVRFHPYPDKSGRYVSVPLSVPDSGDPVIGAWELPSTLSGGARTFLPPDESERRPPSPRGPSQKTLAPCYRGVKLRSKELMKPAAESRTSALASSSVFVLSYGSAFCASIAAT